MHPQWLQRRHELKRNRRLYRQLLRPPYVVSPPRFWIPLPPVHPRPPPPVMHEADIMISSGNEDSNNVWVCSWSVFKPLVIILTWRHE